MQNCSIEEKEKFAEWMKRINNIYYANNNRMETAISKVGVE